MPRAKYQISPEDFQHARFYLSGQLREYGIELDDYDKAQREFWKAADADSKKVKAELLNAWAEKYLSADEWSKLKSAVRKRRQRRYDLQKTVTLSEKAHKLLARVAKQDDITFSEAVEHYMAKAIRSSRGSASSMQHRRGR